MQRDISCWQKPTLPVSLDPRQLHLWRFRLDLPLNEIVTLKSVLSRDEVVRADKLLIEEKRQQFIIARGMLRSILARYANENRSELVFGYGTQGKPKLLNSPDPLYFNLAHSGDWAVLALSRDGDVGMDIEQVAPSLDFMSIAKKYFSLSEYKNLKDATGVRQKRCFYRLWTAKESRLKQQGSGFSTPENSHHNFSPSVQKHLPLCDNHLACVTFSREITSIIKLQVAEI